MGGAELGTSEPGVAEAPGVRDSRGSRCQGPRRGCRSKGVRCQGHGEGIKIKSHCGLIVASTLCATSGGLLLAPGGWEGGGLRLGVVGRREVGAWGELSYDF